MWETIKKAEHQRIDGFELWCRERLLRVPWTARRSNQSILKEISPGCSLEGLMLKLKLQYFGHLMWRTDSLETALILGKIEGRRRRGRQRMRWLDGITDSMDASLSKLKLKHHSGVGDGQGGLACCSPWGHKESDMTQWLNWVHRLLENLKLSIQGTAFFKNFLNKNKGRDHNFIWLWLPGSSEPKTTTCDYWKCLHSSHTPSLAIVLMIFPLVLFLFCLFSLLIYYMYLETASDLLWQAV